MRRSSGSPSLRGLIMCDDRPQEPLCASRTPKIEHLLAILYKVQRTMILTQCAACAKPLAHDAPRRGAGVRSS